MNNILLVDDDYGARQVMANMLSRENFNITTATNAKESMELIKNSNFDVVLTDINMPDLSGLDLLRWIKQRTLNTQVIMITGDPTIESIGDALKEGAFDYITKPLTLTTAVNAIKKAIIVKQLNDENYRLELENLNYRYHLEDLINERTSKLQKTNRQLQREINARHKLEKKLVEITELEQRRIGSDLHDGLGQDLTGMAFLSKVLSNKLKDTSNPACKEAESIVNLANKTVQKMQNLSRGLYPVTLEKEGLLSALRLLIKINSERFEVNCNLNFDDRICFKDNFIKINLYRIAQEAIMNAIKHGQATQIDINLKQKGKRLILTIEDNGKGILSPKQRKEGMGLFIMKRRAKMIHAKFSIKRKTEKGTILKCEAKME